ncbi:hypothetical protein FZC79_18645 [Rossellomorea vietnamensis]|uniref:Lipoprotein n=1 Tax=Rossellomorea vietnamensis TaxID=218284 RepID=A0A5D4K7X1_9BACI|nr:hypothetical protein [Rossellomorea vietnamensis]TYR73461.1 hypothetical protein FZC79_18645 [Rossellomorea vietnamensis]
MKKNLLMLSFILLSIGLFSCQQNSEGESQNNSNTKQNEETANKTNNENYDIVGIVTEVNNEHKRVLIDLTQKIQDTEEELWVTIDENTKVSNKNEEHFSFEMLKPNVALKANLTDFCLEPLPRICFAEEVVIE